MKIKIILIESADQDESYKQEANKKCHLLVK